jgi:hypothetical protein
MARRRDFRLWLPLAAAVLLACGSAAADDLYTVSGVAVDRTAATPQQARDAAIAEGERKAFDILMHRLADSGAASLPKVSDRDVASYVQGFGVDDEHASATRYVATLSVTFQANAVRKLLSGAGVSAVQTGARPLLVLPVLRTSAGQQLLWEDENDWRQSWAVHPPNTGLVPLLVPDGDATDVGAIDVGTAVSGAPASFDTIQQRYQTAGALVAVATPDAGGVALKVTEVLGSGRRDVMSDRIARNPGEKDAALYARAAQAIDDLLEQKYRHDNTVAAGAGGTVTAQIPLDGLDGWLTVRRELQAVGLVRLVALRALSKRAAIVDISFSGDQTQLAAALAQNGLRLEQAGDGWIIRGASSQTSARP